MLAQIFVIQYIFWFVDALVITCMHSDCQQKLLNYAWELQNLQKHLQNGEWDEVWYSLQLCKRKLDCKKCREDESRESGVLGVLQEVECRWQNYEHPCHGHLLKRIRDRLAEPLNCQSVPIAELMFTQDKGLHRVVESACGKFHAELIGILSFETEP